MKIRRLGNSDLYAAPLALGGNVFGWTADESMSFRLLDAFVDRGFNLIDTADVYTRWVKGHHGGESETVIGKWIKKSKKRDKVIIATKVGFDMDPAKSGVHSDERCLKKDYILRAVEDSLCRLQIDTIDLYQTHIDDPATSVEETIGALDLLVRQGKVRAIGASQFGPDRLRESLLFSKNNGVTSYTCLQPGYNLCERENYEKNLKPIVEEFSLGVITFFSLAGGFLSGKYRVEQDLAKNVRGQRTVKSRYFNDKGFRVIHALDKVCSRVHAPMTTVALAWLLSNSTVTAPIASATNIDQLQAILQAPDLRLDKESIDILNEASAF